MPRDPFPPPEFTWNQAWYLVPPKEIPRKEMGWWVHVNLQQFLSFQGGSTSQPGETQFINPPATGFWRLSSLGALGALFERFGRVPLWLLVVVSSLEKKTDPLAKRIQSAENLVRKPVAKLLRQRKPR